MGFSIELITAKGEDRKMRVILGEIPSGGSSCQSFLPQDMNTKKETATFAAITTLHSLILSKNQCD